MSQYVEYLLEDGSVVLIETGESVIAVRGDQRDSIPSKLNFKNAFTSVRSTVKEILAELDDLHVFEGEIKFGLKSTGEAGIFAIGKVGGEMNFEVTVKWKK